MRATLIGLAAILFAAGCSARAREAGVQFSGRPAYGAFYADTRVAAELCPVCSRTVARDDKACKNTRDGKPCATRIRHPERAVCGFCRGSKQCDPCAAFGTSGRCRYCAGTGRLEPATDCFNCGGSGVCAACGGTGGCDACAATGEIKLPWTRPAARALASRNMPDWAQRPVRQDRYVGWIGERVSWSCPSVGSSASWAVYRGDAGEKAEVGRVSGGEPRYLATQPGSYFAESGSASLYFDIIDLGAKRPTPESIGSGTPIQASLEPVPALGRAAVTWEVIAPGGATTRVEGTTISTPALTQGRYEVWPIVELPGLPGRRPPRPLVYIVTDLRIVPGPKGPLLAGVPIDFRAESRPALASGSTYQWTFKTDGLSHAVQTDGPDLQFPLPRAGKYTVEVRCGECLSVPLEIVAAGVSLLDAENRPVGEVGMATFEGAFDDQKKLREDWMHTARERVRVVVQDPGAGAEATVSIATRSPDGAVLNPPVSHSLADASSRPLVFVSDADDDRAPVGGRPDDTRDDPTFHATTGGTVEVFYRGVKALVAVVGPTGLREIPVRFVAVRGLGGDYPPVDELGRILDARLVRVNEVWSKFGLRFKRSSVVIVEPPKNLLLIVGRAAGVDVRGGPARAGILADGVEHSVLTYWGNAKGPMAPLTTARLLERKMEKEWDLATFERLFPTDAETVILRLRRRHGREADFKPLATATDAAQTIAPLAVDLSDGCEVSGRARTLSIDELGLLLGLKDGPGEGLLVFVVGEMRSGLDRPAFKVYPDWAFPEILSGAAIVSWAIADDSDEYPYALARVVGELLLPRAFRPQAPYSLFEEDLSKTCSLLGNKRVDRETGTRLFDRARKLTVEK